VLTYSPTDRTYERWLQRTLGQVGEQLAAVRERIFTLAQPQRHHVVLDLNAGSGLLTRKHYAAYRKVEFMPALVQLIPMLYKNKRLRFQN